MPHFFIKSNIVSDGFIKIDDKNTLAHLIGSLRVKVGQNLKFIDEEEIQYETTVESIAKNVLIARVGNFYQSKRKLNYDLSLVQSVLKPDAQNLLISNATQCGVARIFPVISDNCTVSKKSTEGKVEKWQKIANEAAKQCERANFTTVAQISCLKEALRDFKKENILIFAEKYSKFDVQSALINADKNSPIAVAIGPEGGFSEDEFKYFIKEDFKLLTLGELIFKAPNAVVAGISNIVTRLK